MNYAEFILSVLVPESELWENDPVQASLVLRIINAFVVLKRFARVKRPLFFHSVIISCQSLG